MAQTGLLITVRLLDARWHGAGAWPPPPFRLFQALVAGALQGQPPDRAEQLAPAFSWLEALPPPTIAAPATRRGTALSTYEPNNDWELEVAKGHHRSRAATKRTRPRLIEADVPILYLWPLLEPQAPQAASVVAAASQLYRLGRGVDMAFALAEVLPFDEAEARLAASGGCIHRPTGGIGGTDLPCPTVGSYASLLDRHGAATRRQLHDGLRLPPPPRFRTVGYEAPWTRFLFDLVAETAEGGFRPQPATSVGALTERVRDRLASLLRRHHDDARVERLIVGRGAGSADKLQRPRLIPLPSIGMRHSDQGVRRILLEVPPDCPLPAEALAWAAGCVHLGADEHGEVIDEGAPRLVRAADDAMLHHYGCGTPATRWRTITPIALPIAAARRPGRLPGSARAAGEAATADGLGAALRHAGIAVAATAIHLRREPFERHGARAGAFAPGTRFTPDRLWHAEIVFAAPVAGPLVIGDGRWLGLGLLAPVREPLPEVALYALASDRPLPADAATDVVAAVRRAVMALARDDHGRVPPLFSGHGADGAPLRRDHHAHVFLAAADADGDGRLDSLVFAAPWACDGAARPANGERRAFAEVAGRLRQVRAGGRGVLSLTPNEEPHPLTAPAGAWRSATSYRPTRHPRRPAEAAAAVAADVIAECARRRLPRPAVTVDGLAADPVTGDLVARLTLRFAVAVPGPLLLGRGSHKGQGLFVPVP